MTTTHESRKHEWMFPTACSDDLRDEIRAESQYILTHPNFRNSKRCVALFQYVIARALDGELDSLKERVLGVKVFGRNTDYDSNADPIVRITANEIRKRLAQCYSEDEMRSKIRIHLMAGSYVPQFEMVEPATAELVAAAGAESVALRKDAEEHGNSVQLSPDEPKKRKAHWHQWLLGVMALVILIGASTVLLLHRDTTQELIWKPLLTDQDSVLICVNDSRNRQDELLDSGWAQTIFAIINTHEFPNVPLKDKKVPALSLVDAKVASRIMTALSRQRRESVMQGSSSVSLADLRRGPDVVVGAFNNPWFLILLSRVRFHVMLDPNTQDEWIEDSQNPGSRVWHQSGKLQFVDSSVDYALITRFRSPDTGTWVLGIGGLGMHGTEAAGELLTSPAWGSTIPRNLVEGNKNFQIVLKTTVINGNSGPPQIVASYSW
jgi:hypothetical protein